MSEITCFTDGGYNPRYNMGSYAAVFYQGEKIVREISGTRPAESAEYMELVAIIEALNHVAAGSAVLIHTDCSSVKDKAEWLRDELIYPAGNFREWQRLAGLMAEREVTFSLVPGHNRVTGNERADTLCRWELREAIRK